MTGSTNADLAAAAAQGAPGWTVLVAGHQEAGRGRLGRTWESKPGQSLLVSVLLRPSIAPDDAPLLSLGAGVAVAEACRATGATAVDCKWPNDAVAGERKLAGILPEASVAGGRLEHVVIGIGLNVSQDESDFPESIRGTATSVGLEGGRVDAADALTHVLAGLRRWLEPEEDLRDRVLPRYRELCSTVGRRVRADVSGGSIEGEATGVGDHGELVVETAEGKVEIGFGEVVHLDDQGLPGRSPEG